MDLGKIERNRQRMVIGKEKVMVVKKEERDEEYEQVGCLEEDKKRKGVVGGGGGGSGRKGSGGGVGGLRCCQAEKCTADLTDAKQYHRRHKVCEIHAKAQVVVVGGLRQRFCQQCSRLGAPILSCFVAILFVIVIFVDFFVLLNWVLC